MLAIFGDFSMVDQTRYSASQNSAAPSRHWRSVAIASRHCSPILLPRAKSIEFPPSRAASCVAFPHPSPHFPLACVHKPRCPPVRATHRPPRRRSGAKSASTMPLVYQVVHHVDAWSSWKQYRHQPLLQGRTCG
jgi:hypothetical protein